MSCCISEDEKYLFSCGADHTLRMWDPDTSETIRIFFGHSDKVICCTAKYLNNKLYVFSGILFSMNYKLYQSNSFCTPPPPRP